MYFPQLTFRLVKAQWMYVIGTMLSIRPKTLEKAIMHFCKTLVADLTEFCSVLNLHQDDGCSYYMYIGYKRASCRALDNSNIE